MTKFRIIGSCVLVVILVVLAILFNGNSSTEATTETGTDSTVQTPQ